MDGGDFTKYHGRLLKKVRTGHTLSIWDNELYLCVTSDSQQCRHPCAATSSCRNQSSDSRVCSGFPPKWNQPHGLTTSTCFVLLDVGRLTGGGMECRSANTTDQISTIPNSGHAVITFFVIDWQRAGSRWLRSAQKAVDK